jgi:WD40 repeat protein
MKTAKSLSLRENADTTKHVSAPPALALPDVAVFDARTGHLDYSFFSGQPEAQISYGPDGKSLYCVVDSGALPMTFLSYHVRNAIRVFSATDGKLMRAIHVPRTGVRSSLVFSPNGKLIVADASTVQPDLFRDPGDVGRKVRFVILDGHSGWRLLTANLGVWHSEAPPSFFFSPDGQTLVVDPNPNSTGEGPVKIFRLVGTQ